MDPGQVVALQLLFFGRLADHGGSVGMMPRSALDGVAPSQMSEAIRHACAEAQCKAYVQLELIAFGDGLRVAVSERDPAGKELFHGTLKAHGMEDAEAVVDRLARAVATRTAPARTIDRDNVIVADGKPGRRKSSERSTGLSSGLAVPMWTDPKPAVRAALVHRGVREHFFLGISFGALIPTSREDCEDSEDSCVPSSFGYGFFDVEAAYIARGQQIAPYFGGGAGPRVGGVHEVGMGFGAFGLTGVTFDRLSKVRAFGQLRIGGDWLPTDHPGPQAVFQAGLEVGMVF